CRNLGVRGSPREVSFRSRPDQSRGPTRSIRRSERSVFHFRRQDYDQCPPLCMALEKSRKIIRPVVCGRDVVCERYNPLLFETAQGQLCKMLLQSQRRRVMGSSTRLQTKHASSRMRCRFFPGEHLGGRRVDECANYYFRLSNLRTYRVG